MKAPTTPSRMVRTVREGSLSNRRNGRTRRAVPTTALAFASTFLATSAVASAPTTAAPRYSDFQPAYQNLGTWLPLDMSGNAQGNTPAVFETSGDNAYDLWLDKSHGLYTYEVAELGPDGGVLAPAQSIFGPTTGAAFPVRPPSSPTGPTLLWYSTGLAAPVAIAPTTAAV